MKTRSALLVVLATAAVLGCGLLGAIFVGKAFQSLRNSLTSEAARQQFVAQWRPPASVSPTLVFPDSVVGFRRALDNPLEKWRDPNLDLDPIRARYERPTKADVEVFACQATPEQAKSVLDRTKDTFKARSGKTSAMQTSLQTHDRLQLSSSDPQESVEIWTLHGWLFLFRSTAVIDPAFIRAYLSAIDGRSGG